MNFIENLTPTQLRRAAEIKEEIQNLNAELRQLLGSSPSSPGAPAAPQGKTKRTMSAAARALISAAQKKRWAKRAAAPVVAGAKTKPAKKAKWSAASKAKLAARMKEIWAKRKSAKQS